MSEDGLVNCINEGGICYYEVQGNSEKYAFEACITFSDTVKLQERVCHRLSELICFSVGATLGVVDCNIPCSSKLKISFLITNNHEIKDLNNRFRGKNYPTNVLSWSYIEHDNTLSDEDVIMFSGSINDNRIAYVKEEDANEKVCFIGDIAMSLEQLAAERNVSGGMCCAGYIARILIHAVLHLFGYDHDSDIAEDSMLGLEYKALSKIKELWSDFSSEWSDILLEGWSG